MHIIMIDFTLYNCLHGSTHLVASAKRVNGIKCNAPYGLTIDLCRDHVHPGGRCYSGYKCSYYGASLIHSLVCLSLSVCLYTHTSFPLSSLPLGSLFFSIACVSVWERKPFLGNWNVVLQGDCLNYKAWSSFWKMWKLCYCYVSPVGCANMLWLCWTHRLLGASSDALMVSYLLLWNDWGMGEADWVAVRIQLH